MAVGLYAGFYLLGAAVVAAIAWLPWAQVHYTGGIEPSGMIACVGVLYVLWALIPRWRRWSAPGPELSRTDQPALHALVDDVARAAGHATPRALYMVLEPTAMATSRPRWGGLRREPVVGLGLPLFALLTRAQLAAVVAHEFGHHVGGDVRLGPWQHRTFQAIAAALHRLDGSSVFLHLPFYAYGRLFLRLSGAASREQELRADALAARIAGRAAIADALVATVEQGDRWYDYWGGVFTPAVDAGFLMPLLDGYRRFMAEPARADERPSSLAAVPEDTHPPLAARLAALGPVDSRPAGPPDAVADALRDVAVLESRLITTVLRDAAVLPRLKRLEWDDWGREVLPAVWAHQLGDRERHLRDLKLTSLPSLLQDSWWERLRGGINVFSPEARQRQLRAWLGRWLGLSLLAAGYRVTSGPGAEPTLERDGSVVQPFIWIEDLAAGRRTADEWCALVGAIGVVGAL
jgi:Zn-dependent protease with chaperone function